MKIKRFIFLNLFLAISTSVFAAAPDSIYSVPFGWKDDTGQEVTLNSFKGEPVVLTLAYTKCKQACPMTIQRLKKLADSLKTRAPKAQFVIVSLDPAQDTPETLAMFRRHHALEDSKWHLLTGTDSEVRKLSVLLGYSYQRQEGAAEEIAHSNKIVALTADGAIGAEVEGLSSDLEPFAKEIGAMKSGNS